MEEIAQALDISPSYGTKGSKAGRSVAPQRNAKHLGGA